MAGARSERDTCTVGLILAENFYETTQNGTSRSKTQTGELWTSVPIDSLTTESAEVKITGDTAVLAGAQTEYNGTGSIACSTSAPARPANFPRRVPFRGPRS